MFGAELVIVLLAIYLGARLGGTAVHRPESQNFTSGTVCAPSSAAK